MRQAALPLVAALLCAAAAGAAARPPAAGLAGRPEPRMLVAIDPNGPPKSTPYNKKLSEPVDIPMDDPRVAKLTPGCADAEQVGAR